MIDTILWSLIGMGQSIGQRVIYHKRDLNASLFFFISLSFFVSFLTKHGFWSLNNETSETTSTLKVKVGWEKETANSQTWSNFVFLTHFWAFFWLPLDC